MSEGRAPTGDVTSAAALQIPWNVWPDGTVKGKSGIVTPKQADNPNDNAFADVSFHRQSYTRHGMVGGYYQQADLVLNKSNDTIHAYWLGSYYSSPGDASGRVTDSINTMHLQGFREQPCYLPDQPNCVLFLTGPGVYVLYATWSDGNAVGELAIVDNMLLLGKATPVVGGDLQTLLKQGDATIAAAVGSAPVSGGAAEPPASEPTISIDNLSLWHYASGKLVKTSALNLHETAYFVAAFHVSAVAVYSQSGTLTLYAQSGRVRMIEHKIKKPDTTIFDGRASLGYASDGTIYFDTVGTFDDPADEGPLTVQVTATQHSASDTRSLDFTLQKPVVHCKKGYRAKFGTCFKKKK